MVLSTFERRSRWFALSVSVLPLIGAIAYAQGMPHIPFLACPLRSLTGIPCPTCGMTRAFVAIAQGDVAQALNYHAFSPIVMAGFAIASVHWLRELRRNTRLALPSGSLTSGWLLLAAAMLYYGVRMVSWYQSGELTAAMQASPIAAWLTRIS